MRWGAWGLEGRGWLASKHVLHTGEATALPALEEVAGPTTRCVAHPGWGEGGGKGKGRQGEGRPGKGGRGAGRGGGEGGRPLGPRTASRLLGTCCHSGRGPSPCHLMSCHSPALKGEGEDRGRGRRPPRQTARTGTSPQPGAGPVASVNRFQNH